VGDHPVKVPEELVKELAVGARLPYTPATEAQWQQRFAQRAAQWGADQELEACVEWLEQGPFGFSVAASDLVKQLRAARRPKPPSLAEQGLKALGPSVGLKHFRTLSVAEQDDIRAALNRLAELEAMLQGQEVRRG